jgi:Na+-driven multidrug efflux pump
LTAKFHLLEMPFYALALWFFLPRFGLVGAAWAWVLRISLDAALLFFAVLKLKFISPRAMMERPLQRTFLALTLPAVLLPLSWITTSFGFQIGLSVVVMLVFVTAVWGYVLDHNERHLLISALDFRARLARAK